MIAENFVTSWIGFHSLWETGTCCMHAGVKCTRKQEGFTFTEMACGICIITGFLHMCFFMVSEPRIICGHHVALKGCCGFQGCHLHSFFFNADVFFAAFVRLQFSRPGLVEFRRGRGIVPYAEQNACSDLGPTRGFLCYESVSTGLVNREQGSGPVVRRKKHRWICSGENVAGSATCKNEDGLGNDREEPRQSRCLA